MNVFVNQQLCLKIQLKDTFNKTSDASVETCTNGKLKIEIKVLLFFNLTVTS